MAQIKAFLNAIPHWVIVVLMTSGGAAWTYLQQVGPGSFFDAIQSWATLKPILEGAGGAFLMTMIALLRKEPWMTSAAFLVLFGVSVSACAAVRSAFDWGEAECAIIDQTPQPIEVTIVCDVIDAAGTVVDVLSMKAPPDEAAGIVLRHPVKSGHPDPRMQVAR